MQNRRLRSARRGQFVLVDGAAGFLGSHVVERLRSEGLAVRATDLAPASLSRAEAAGAEAVACDLLDRARVREVVRGAKSVVHTAGLFDYSLPPETLRGANVEATRNVCEACLGAGIERFVHVSSVAVYGDPKTVPIREDHPLLPNNVYGRTKAEGEGIAFSFHSGHALPVVSIRPAGIYGPRSRYGQVHLFTFMALLRAQGRRAIPMIDGGPLMHHVHVADVVEGIWTLLEGPAVPGEAYNVADETPLSQGDFLRFVMAEVGLRRSFAIPYSTRFGWRLIRLLLALPESSFRTANGRLGRAWEKVVDAERLEPMLTPRFDRDYLGYMVGDHVLDTSKIGALGFRPKHPSTAAGMARTIEWYREMRWLPPKGPVTGGGPTSGTKPHRTR